MWVATVHASRPRGDALRRSRIDGRTHTVRKEFASEAGGLTFCANRSAADVLMPVVMNPVRNGFRLATSLYHSPKRIIGAITGLSSAYLVYGASFSVPRTMVASGAVEERPGALARRRHLGLQRV